MPTRVIKHNNDAELSEAGRVGAEAIRAGKLVGFATETVYGLAVSADNAEALARLRELKSRPKKPFSVYLADPADVHRYVSELPREAERLISKTWPGPVTIILPTGGKLADGKLQKAGLHRVLCSANAIGLRCPDSPIGCAMLGAVDGPVVGPSANRSGQPSPTSAADVMHQLDGKIDLLIDSGPTRYERDSTIVQFTKRKWKVLREGVFDKAEIAKLMRKTFLFVCTGNTCRSPLAEGLARKLLSDDTECISAGAFAAVGQYATPEAVQAAAELGADISNHLSKKLTIDLINSADMIFCMSDAHVSAVLALVPAAVERVSLLDKAGPIDDPIGGGVDVYLRTGRRIERVLKSILTDFDEEKL